jgi:hypothetical protein
MSPSTIGRRLASMSAVPRGFIVLHRHGIRGGTTLRVCHRKPMMSACGLPFVAFADRDRPCPMRKTAATSEKIMAMAPLGRRRSDIRDRALLLLGFAGAFRRSELVGLTLSKATQRRVGAPPYSAAMSPRARDGSE